MKLAIGLMVISTFIISAVQLFLKTGAENIGMNITSAILNYHLWIGMILYGIAAILIIIALKKGEVTILFPITTLSYVWVNIGANYYLGESLNSYKWIGIIAIIGGIITINIMGGKND